MEKGVFKFIWRFSKRQQITLLALIVVSYPVYYFTLELPKTIINQAIGGTGFPKAIYSVEYSQIEYLLALSFAFLALVIAGGVLKYVNNVYRGMAGERMLRRLRYQLVHRVLLFPLPQFRNVSEGEIVAMVTTETEPLGGFMGEAYALPAYQGGLLITALVFMFAQDPILGLAAIALYPLQGWLIPKLQKRVNLLAKERVKTVRKLSERISETVSGVSEIHAHDTAQYELADFSNRLGTVFGIRVRIYKLKFFIKFINNFLAQVTPFFFFSIGGYLVIQGDLSIGALVAILAAYKDLGPPWKELLNFYQRMEDSKIKYNQLVERFSPDGLLREELLEPAADAPPDIDGPIVANKLTLRNDDGDSLVESANFQFDAGQHVSFVGAPGGGKTEIAQLLARQLVATSGTIKINGADIAEMPESFIGRRLGYVDQDAYIRSGSIRDNLYYGLKHYPHAETEDETLRADFTERLSESEQSGNSAFDINANWVNPEGGGNGDLLILARGALQAVGLELDVLTIGLKSTIDPDENPDLASGVLEARKAVAAHLNDPAYQGLVETWARERYNRNASVAENILFGTPIGDTFAVDSLGTNPHILSALDKTDLHGRFIEMGRKVAQLMIELFKDLPPGHEFFERYSFIDADDLPEFQNIVTASKDGFGQLTEQQRHKLIELPFRLIPSKHRLGLIDDEMATRLLALRRAFAETLPEDLAGAISFFDIEQYNPASSILDNMLFGKIDSSRADANEKIMEFAIEVLDELSLRLTVLDAGLSSEVGIAGRRLSALQRQKLAIARNLVKQPSLLVVNEATAAFDPVAQAQAFEAIRASMKGRGLVWVGGENPDHDSFDQLFRVDNGRVRTTDEAAPASDEPEQQPADKGAGGEIGSDTELLSRIPFFAGLDRSKLKLLAFTSERQTLEPREVLFKQGDPGDLACVVVEGSCSVIAETTERRIKIAEIGRGGLIGELALLCEAPRTATVQADGRTTILKITKEVFIRLIKENPAVGANLSRILANKLETMTRGISAQYELYDPITGLPNRNLFIDYMRTAAIAQQRLGERTRLILFDIPAVAEQLREADLGQQHDLFRQVANRVKPIVRGSDTLGALGEFRFGMIARESGQEPSTTLLIERIREALAEPIDIGDESFDIADSLVIEEYDIERENVHNLMDRV